ncbi:MAG: sulfite oxidase-like oxidoreductase [Methanobacterium sp.]|nr:sulfite oxidase-like oxidoreductase [Methanobacterium sp.]
MSDDTKRKNRIPPGQHEVEEWPVLQAGSVQKIDTSKWKFRIFGLVEEEKELSYEEFMSLSPSRVFSDIHCVTSWSKLNNLWEGVSSSAIKEVVKILPEAKFVMIHAEKDFTINLSIEDFFEDDVLFATKHNDIPLNSKHGGPLRLVVPKLYFWKSAKWVTGVEFISENKRGFWESNGYHNRGDPWKEERYSWQEK